MITSIHYCLHDLHNLEAIGYVHYTNDDQFIWIMYKVHGRIV
jgi:hypothetical protein